MGNMEIMNICRYVCDFNKLLISFIYGNFGEIIPLNVPFFKNTTF